MEKWEAAARRTLVGPKSELRTLADESGKGEYWLQPRKFSKQGADEIRAAEAIFLKAVSGETLDKLGKVYLKIQSFGDRPLTAEQKKDAESAGQTEAEFRRGLLEKEFEQMLDSGELGLSEIMAMTENENVSADVMRLKLRYGTEAQNLTEKCGQLDDETIERLLEWKEVGLEALSIIDRWNRPLATGSAVN